MSCQVKTSGQCQLRNRKDQYFSIVSLPTDSVIVDQAVQNLASCQTSFRRTQLRNNMSKIMLLRLFLINYSVFKKLRASLIGIKF
jgi:hypothetical protein